MGGLLPVSEALAAQSAEGSMLGLRAVIVRSAGGPTGGLPRADIQHLRVSHIFGGWWSAVITRHWCFHFQCVFSLWWVKLDSPDEESECSCDVDRFGAVCVSGDCVGVKEELRTIVGGNHRAESSVVADLRGGTSEDLREAQRGGIDCVSRASLGGENKGELLCLHLDRGGDNFPTEFHSDCR